MSFCWKLTVFSVVNEYFENPLRYLMKLLSLRVASSICFGQGVLTGYYCILGWVLGRTFGM